MKSRDERSPLKDKPLRLPGQALQEQRQALLEDKMEPWLLVAVFMAVFAAYEWWRYWKPAPPMPWLFTAMAAATAAAATWRFLKLRPMLRALRQGMEGERAVGQFLERLREQGYQVFHDLQGDGFNVDHVLVGGAGVFTIETKTWSKPRQGDARIRYDGQSLTIHGREPERDVLAQARAQASWMARLLKDSTGRQVTVRSVVVFPGWYVEASAAAQRDTWVLEPKALPAFLEHQPPRLAAEDVKLLAYHLSRHIRAEGRDREA